MIKWVMLIVWGVPMIGNPPIVLPQKYETEEACQRAGVAMIRASQPTAYMCMESRELDKQDQPKK